MSQVLLTDANGMKQNKRLYKNMFRFRHKIFFEKLGWQVNSDEGCEHDNYDKLNPIYIVAKDENDNVEGCWRFLPTTGPYMLKDTFPQLLKGEPAPVDEKILEISRFAVCPSNSQSAKQASNNPITIAILRAGYEYAIVNGYNKFVAVTSVAMERLLKKMGLTMTRFGDKKATKVGGVSSVGTLIDIDENFRKAVCQVEIRNTQWDVAA